jgi:hypothetical protein
MGGIKLGGFGRLSGSGSTSAVTRIQFPMRTVPPIALMVLALKMLGFCR